MPRDGHQTPSSAPVALAAGAVRRALAFIDADLANPIAVAALAALSGLSVAHFARRFARAVGMPPARYIRRRRIELAERLLRESTLALAQIAAACGFADQAHFTRSFRAATGTTPLTYRRQRSTGEANSDAANDGRG